MDPLIHFGINTLKLLKKAIEKTCNTKLIKFMGKPNDTRHKILTKRTRKRIMLQFHLLFYMST